MLQGNKMQSSTSETPRITDMKIGAPDYNN